jgi:hypothetical protein
MDTNHLPKIDQSQNETGCCPRFDPAPWEGQELHFRDKPFVRAKTMSLFHIPLNMGDTFQSTLKAIADSGAEDEEFVVLSRDPSAWSGEHFFAVKKEVPGAENVKLSGDFVTHVFEGPFSRMSAWCKEMEVLVSKKGKHLDKLYYFYTTCPKCAKHYGKNYVVGIAQVETEAGAETVKSPEMVA